jgi:mannose-6-phosphate isomerase-like protein (cupin superfamily)
MKSCRNASVVALVVMAPMIAFAACRDPERPEVPPVTAAHPPPGEDSLSQPNEASAPSMRTTSSAAAAPVVAWFVDAPAQVQVGACDRVYIAVVKGKVSAMKDNLAPGDVLLGTLNGGTLDLGGAGTVLVVKQPMPHSASAELCKPQSAFAIVARGDKAQKVEWASGAMRAFFDVPIKLSPELYLGRLEGTSAVPEHTHPTSWEVLAAVEASGTFVLDGTEGKLGPRQVVAIPPGAKHAWKPEQGSKLVAIQMYIPPGPEQRFLTLAAGEKDAGRDAAR